MSGSGDRFFALPPHASWRHEGAREGFEISWFRGSTHGTSIAGCTAAREAGVGWAVEYEISLDRLGVTRSAWVRALRGLERRSVLLDHDGGGQWRVNGAAAPHLSGCLDVDLESSAVTNSLPVRRAAWKPHQTWRAPAAYVRVDLGVEALEQEYTSVGARDGLYRFAYRAPVFDFACEISYDSSGLVSAYPGIATRSD